MGCLKDNRIDVFEALLSGLMKRYMARVPYVEKVISAMLNENLIKSTSVLENDHIAFRTFGVKHLGISSLEKVFLHYGYQKKDNYYFESKKINASWYAHPSNKLPRIFISELRVSELSQQSQNIIYSYTNTVKKDPVDSLDLDDASKVDTFLHSSQWRPPIWEDYKILRAESEYASWVIYNRYYLNHFTISVHNLPEKANTIELFNDFLIRNGIVLNDAGGLIKVSKDGKLKQSSTVAQIVNVPFFNRLNRVVVKPISGSYVEFIERQVLDIFKHLPQDKLKREHLRDGFETENADKIFESTFQNQVKKKIS